MLTLHRLDEAQTRAIYPCIRANFPPDELRPLRMMLSLMRRGVYEVLAIREGAEDMGYALTLTPRGSGVLLDYLVVEERQRGRGLGTEILRLLRVHYAARADVIFIESETPEKAPEPQLAARRMGFYDRAGAVLLPFRMLLFGVDYSMFALPTGEALPEKEWSTALLEVYRQTLPPVFFATQVKLLRS